MPDKRHTYSYPTRIEYGPGAVKDLPKAAHTAGFKKGLLVTDQGLEKVGLAEMVRNYFYQAGIHLTTYDKVKPNPVDDNVYEGAKLFKESKAEFIVALGGGSPMDVGKAIKVIATHDGPLEKYDDTKNGSAFIKNNMPPFYAIATTAGTGSEVGRSSVITLQSTNKKTIIFSPFMMPTIAVLDAELTTSLPPHLTAATGTDALVHNLEAYLMDSFHPLADGIAKEGIRICVKSLPVAVKNGTDIKARGEMLMASSMGAIAFQKGLGINHSIAHALGVFYDLHHGLANAAVLVEVMKFNIKDAKVKTKMASLGAVFGTTNDAEKVIAKLEKWLDSIEMRKTLSELGVDKNQVQQIEDYALEDPCCPLNPRRVEKGDVVRILKKLFMR